MRTISVTALVALVAAGVGLNLYAHPAIGQVVSPVLASTADYWQMIWTAVQAFTGIASVIGLAVTGAFAFGAWQAAKGQVNEAKRNADAAEAAVGVTRTIGEAQARCYPSIQNMRIGWHRFQHYDGVHPVDEPVEEQPFNLFPILHFQIRNFGQTPVRDLAYRMSVKFDAHIVVDGVPYMVERQSERRFPFSDRTDFSYGESIPAGETFNYHVMCGFRTNQFESQVAQGPRSQGGLTVIIVVALSYRDVFGNPICEEHCYLRQLSAENFSGMTPMMRMPLACFETQAELSSRANASTPAPGAVDTTSAVGNPSG